jgi:hypothetical protein
MSRLNIEKRIQYGAEKFLEVRAVLSHGTLTTDY